MKASSDSQGAARIVPAGQVGVAVPAWLGALAASAGTGAALRARDLDTEVGRTAYQLGRRRGLAEGLARGLRDGHAQGATAVHQAQDAQAALALERLHELAQAFDDELRAREHDLAREVAALALAIVRQVLRRELAQPETLQAVALEAMQCVTADAGALVLQVHPSQAAWLADALADHPARARLTLQPDPAIACGGCRLAGPLGEVDATVAARWAAVFTALDWPQEPLDA